MVVTVEQIAVELGRSTPNVDTPEHEQIAAWIARTDRDIQRHFGAAAYATLDEQDVDDVIVLAVSEHARNPDGVDSYDISVDDGRESRRYKHSHGRIVIRDEWWAMLTPGKKRGAFTIRAPFNSGFA